MKWLEMFGTWLKINVIYRMQEFELISTLIWTEIEILWKIFHVIFSGDLGKLLFEKCSVGCGRKKWQNLKRRRWKKIRLINILSLKLFLNCFIGMQRVTRNSCQLPSPISLHIHDGNFGIHSHAIGDVANVRYEYVHT